MRSLKLVALILLSPALAMAGPPILPNPKLTPGAALNVTVQQLAQPGYSRHVRDVPEATKLRVYAEYGITPAKGQYEIDHLISLEIGGSNSIRNLWPQSYHTRPWNAHVKDQLEDRLHALVVSGRMDLATAQKQEAQNWIAEYQQVFHTKLPPASHTRARHSHSRTRSHRTPAAASGPIVWVNTSTGVYHYPGTRWYENTKQGKLMPESEARAEGDRPAENGQ